jgi:hypothetical protein
MNATNTRVYSRHVSEVGGAVGLVHVPTAVQSEQVVEEDSSGCSHYGRKGRIDSGIFKQRAASVENPLI